VVMAGERHTNQPLVRRCRWSGGLPTDPERPRKVDLARRVGPGEGAKKAGNNDIVALRLAALDRGFRVRAAPELL